MRALIALVGLAAVAPAHADDAAAKALFDEGKTLFAEGQYGKACTKLEASYRQAQLSGTRGLLAACYEKLGRFASAWAAYRDAADIAARQGNADRAAAARASAAELVPKLAYVTLDASAITSVPKVKITIDGVEYDVKALGTAIPIDSGQHLVEATAIDYKPWKATIDIQDTEKQQIPIPKLEPDPTRRLLIEARLRDERRVAQRRKRIAFGLTAGGGVAVVVASTLGVLAYRQWGRAQDAGCDDSGLCNTPAGKADVNGAALKADVATYVGAGGLLLVGAGVFVYLTSPKPRGERELELTPSVGPGAAGVVLGGRF